MRFYGLVQPHWFIEVDNSVKPFRWEKTMVAAKALGWTSDGFLIELSIVGSDTEPGYLSRDDLVGRPESMRRPDRPTSDAAVSAPGWRHSTCDGERGRLLGGF